MQEKIEKSGGVTGQVDSLVDNTEDQLGNLRKKTNGLSQSLLMPY